MSEYSEATNVKRSEKQLQKIRKAEVEAVKYLFDRNARVLELGGGNGYQASILASWGCDVASIDLPNRPISSQVPYYPIQEYDGVNIPYPDESFDVVFSCAVLPAIKALPMTLAETRRVLKHEGIAIHILESRTWGIWTSLSRPVYLSQKLLQRLRRSASHAPNMPSSARNTGKPNAFRRIKQVLFPGSWAGYPNVLVEIYYSSQGHWLSVFKENGFEVKWVSDTGLFYTGHALAPSLSLRARRILSRFLGASSNVFVMRKSKA